MSTWKSAKECMVCYKLGCWPRSYCRRDWPKNGYHQSEIIPGLWKHESRPIMFTLVVDDFGVTYVNKEDAEHLMSVLKQNYEVTEDWEGERYIGMHLW